MKKYTDQEFLYRQTPVNYDGIAKFTSIKGNTLGWNQIFIPQYRSNSGIQVGSIQDGNDYSVRIYGTATANAWLRMDATGTLPVGHKFLLDKGSTSDLFDINNDNNGLLVDFSAKTKIGTITTADKYIYIFVGSGTTIDVTVKPILIDLTKMFGEGNEPSTVEEFTSLFPLPYYDYNAGRLLSFNGTGLKTVGKNLLENNGELGNINPSGVDESNPNCGRSSYYTRVIPNTNYVFSHKETQETVSNRIYFYDSDGNFISPRITQGGASVSFTTPQNAYTMRWAIYVAGVTVTLDYLNALDFQLEFGSSPTSYDPYASTTTDLPISTYFPTGMKRAGNVYDELTESKAITRVGSRAYQSGDENNANYVTDGTTTYYPLATETETDAEDIFYKFYGNGTEQILPVNGATPTTAPIIADIEYYNQIESETPYRKFWLVNGNGERWDLTEKELKSFLENPQGLGFQKTIDVTRYGERANKNTESYNFPQVTGDVLFYDSANSTRYEKYNEFVRFLMEQPITLHYMIPVSYNSLIADTYSLECEVMSLTKTESKTDRILTSNIQMNGLGFYEGDEIEINGTANTLTINNNGDFPVGFEIELNGDFKNPYFTLEQNGELYGEAKFDDNANNFSSVFVNSKDGEQNVVLKQNNSIMPNPLAYQDLSISNGSIYVTFVKLAKGESTLTIGGDSYTISGYTIRYTPIYRSV